MPSLKRATWTNRSTARADLLPDGAHAHVGIGHPDHHLQPAHGVARGVGVDGRERAVVAGVHGLQHVERLLAAHLADDDAVGTHTEGIDHQLPDADGALAFDVGRTRFHARHVRLRSRSSAASSMVTMRSSSGM